MVSEHDLLQPVTDVQLVRRIVREHPYGFEDYTRRSLEELDLLAELKQLGLAESSASLTIGEFLRGRSWRHVGETGHLFLRPVQRPGWSIGLNAPSIAFVQLFENHRTDEVSFHAKFNKLYLCVTLIRQHVIQLTGWLSLEDFLARFE